MRSIIDTHPVLRAIVIATLVVAPSAGCRLFDASGAPAWEEGPVKVATVWPWESRPTLLYGEGLQMAVDEVNEGGGILGRPLTVLREDDHESVNQGRRVAQRLTQTEGSSP